MYKRQVLDIGCGEGAWRAPLLKLRPGIDYLGFDASDYAIARYGRSRNLHQASFGEFQWLRPCPPADLLVCSDVLHYVPDAELRRGLPALAELCGGLAFIEAFTGQDDASGDQEGFIARPGTWYRAALEGIGMQAVGSHGWLPPTMAGHAATLERCC